MTHTFIVTIVTSNVDKPDTERLADFIAKSVNNELEAWRIQTAQFKAKAEARLRTVEAERDRLRAALHDIATWCDGDNWLDGKGPQGIAARALAPKEDPCP